MILLCPFVDRCVELCLWGILGLHDHRTGTEWGSCFIAGVLVGGLLTEGRTPLYDLGGWNLNDELAAVWQGTVAT